MNLRFAKMHGLGNDFMVLDLVSQSVTLDPHQVACWADRHTGVGFDQLLTVEPPPDPDVDFRYRIYNADGSEAEQCGNGARCIAHFVRHAGLTVKSELKFQTANGLVQTRLLGTDQVEVDMGRPQLAPESVPCDVKKAEACRTVQDARRFDLRTGNGNVVELTPVSLGNPHGVLQVDDISTAPVAELGSELTGHPFFPARANIGFCQIVDRNFVRLRVYERGVGETRACGTGACAAVVVGQLAGLLDERVKVSLPGGKVRVRWQGNGGAVKMTGPATLVYEGQITTG